MEGFDSIHSGQDFEDLFGKVDTLTPYVTKFNVSEIQAAIDRESTFTITKEFFDAVEKGRLIVIPEYGGENQPQIVTKCGYAIDNGYRSVSVRFISPDNRTIYLFNASIEDGTESIELPGTRILFSPLQYQLRDGENLATINGQPLLRGGNITINEPYLAPFSVQELDDVIDGYRLRFQKDEFITAVVSGRPLVVPIRVGDNSGITASYYVTFTETGREIVIDIIHGSKVYHLILEDILENTLIIVLPDNVSCKETSNVYVVPYTLSEIQNAANKGTTLQVDVDFVDAVYNKKLILIPNGKTVADGQYISVFYTLGSAPDSSVNITLCILYGTKTFDIRLSSKSVAPTAAGVTITETPLMTEKKFSTIYSGDSLTITRPNTQFTVNSIDGATFTNNGKTTAMTPNTVYNFVNNGVNRTIAVYDDHRVVITSENNSTVALSPGVTYTSRARIIPSALPSSLVTKPELRESIQVNQSDWSAEEGKSGHIKNRTHYYRIHSRLKLGFRFSIIVDNNSDFDGLNDYKVFLNNKFYEFDESFAVGGTITFGTGEEQQAVVTVLSKITSGSLTVYEYRLEAVSGLAPDSNGLVLDIVTKGKTLDPIYLPDNVAYNDKLKTINGESLAGKGDIKLVTKEEWDNKGYTYKFTKITSAGEYEITPPGGGLKDFCVIFNQKTFILEEYVRTQVWSGNPVYVTLKHPDDGSYYLEVEDSSGYLSEYPLLYVKEATPFPSVLIPTELLPQSDWTETNETKSTYIKNRSHYWKSMGPGTYELELTESSIGTTVASVGDYFMLYESVYLTSEVIGKDIEIPRWGPSLILTVIEEGGTYYLKHLSGTSYPGPTIRFNAYVSVKTLDDVYIPDTIARTKDLEDITPKKQIGSVVPEKLLPNVFYEFSNIDSLVLPPLEGDSIEKQNKWMVSAILSNVDALSIPYKVQWANGDKPEFADYSILEITLYKTATGVIYGEWKSFENKFLDVYPKETMWLPSEDNGSLDINFEVKSNTDWEIK